MKMNIVRKTSVKYMLMSSLFLLLSTLAGCADSPPPILRIGTNIWPGYEPLYLAKELGYFKNNRVHLVEHSSASSVITAFNNQAIEAAGVTLDEALLLQQNNHDIRIVLVTDISHGADAIVARPEIKTLSALKNKRVAVENSALGAFFLSRALAKAKLELHDVKIIKTQVNHHEKIYQQGKADAVVTFDPVRTKLLKLGANQIFDSSQISGEIVDVLVVRASYLNNHPEVIKKLINTWFKTLGYIQKNPTPAYQKIAQRLDISVEDTALTYQGLSLPDREQNIILLTENNDSLFVSSQKLNQVMLKNGLLNKAVNTDSLFSDKTTVMQFFQTSSPAVDK